jgi:25S rRNA (adenine2142-N1)-methyltransferase
MLELGALLPDNYDAQKAWIDNHPIDLNSRHADIVEQDFLERPLPATEAEHFDVISCSLVMNFVPDAKDRGELLTLLYTVY